MSRCSIDCRFEGPTQAPFLLASEPTVLGSRFLPRIMILGAHHVLQRRSGRVVDTQDIRIILGDLRRRREVRATIRPPDKRHIVHRHCMFVDVVPLEHERMVIHDRVPAVGRAHVFLVRMLGAILVAVFVFVVWVVVEADGKCRRLEAKFSPGLRVRRQHVATEAFEVKVWVFGKFRDDIGVAFGILALEVDPLLA
jgi:hypothetical protein